MTRSGLKRGAAAASEGAAAAAAVGDGKRAKAAAATVDAAEEAMAPADHHFVPIAVDPAAAAAGGQMQDDPVVAAEHAAAAATAAASPGEEQGGGSPEGAPAAPTATATAGKGSSRAVKSSAATTIRGQAYHQQQHNAEQHMANFDHYLFQLLAFKASTGNFHVPKGHELHSWIQFLKKEFKNHSNHHPGDHDGKASGTTGCALSEEQIKVLELLHVPLTSRGDEHWNRFYELLNQYGQRHGHVLVPRLCEVPGLGDWVTDQRRQYKAWRQGQMSQLTDDRRLKLEQLGFAWQVRNRPEWDLRFQQLLEYREKNGDCKVPQHYKENRALGKWTAKQREQYKLMKKGKHTFLTPYRLEKLNQIGFVWQVRTSLDEELEEGTGKGAVKEEEAAGSQLKEPPTNEGGAPTKTDEDLVIEAAAAAVALAPDATKPPEDAIAIANV